MSYKSKFLKDARICFSLSHYDGFCSGICENNGKYLYFDLACSIDKIPRKFHCYELEPEIMLILFDINKQYENYMGYYCSYKMNENKIMISGKNKEFKTYNDQDEAWKEYCEKSHILYELIREKLPNTFNKIDKRFKYIGYAWYSSLLGKYKDEP